MKPKYHIGQKVRFDEKNFGNIDYLPHDLQKYLRGTITIIGFQYNSNFYGYEVVVDYQSGVHIPAKYILPVGEDSTEYED